MTMRNFLVFFLILLSSISQALPPPVICYPRENPELYIGLTKNSELLKNLQGMEVINIEVLPYCSENNPEAPVDVRVNLKTPSSFSKFGLKYDTSFVLEWDQNTHNVKSVGLTPEELISVVQENIARWESDERVIYFFEKSGLSDIICAEVRESDVGIANSQGDIIALEEIGNVGNKWGFDFNINSDVMLNDISLFLPTINEIPEIQEFIKIEGRNHISSNSGGRSIRVSCQETNSIGGGPNLCIGKSRFVKLNSGSCDPYKSISYHFDSRRVIHYQVSVNHDWSTLPEANNYAEAMENKLKARPLSFLCNFNDAISISPGFSAQRQLNCPTGDAPFRLSLNEDGSLERMELPYNFKMLSTIVFLSLSSIIIIILICFYVMKYKRKKN